MEIDPLEDTFIASSMSPQQQQLLARHPTDRALTVDGGYIVYSRDQAQTYYMLKAEFTDEEQKADENFKNTPRKFSVSLV